MSKKSKQNISNKKSQKRLIDSFDSSTTLPAGAEPVDHIAFQIMLKYVNGTSTPDIKHIVQNSYRMADEYVETFNERHGTTK